MAEPLHPLDQLWDDAIGPYVSVRVARCLREIGFDTMREVIDAARGNDLLEHRSFGRGSLRILREAIAGWRARNPLAEPEVVEQADAGDAAAGADPGPDPLDVPWDQALPDLSVRNMALLQRRGATTVRDALDAAEDPTLLRERNFGRRSLRDLRRAIDEFVARTGADPKRPRETLAEPAFGSTAAGPPETPNPAGPPASIREFVEASIQEVPEKHRAVFLARFRDGRTLLDIGQEEGLTRERIRQKCVVALKKARQRVAKQASAVMAAPLETLDEHRILHFTDLAEVSGGADAGTVQLGLLFAGDDLVQVWREEFLVRCNASEAESQLRLARQALRDIGRATVSTEDAREAILSATGWRLSDVGLERLLSLGLGVEVTSDGVVPLESLLRFSGRCVAMIREAGRPMHLSEIAAVVLDAAAEEDVEAELAGDDAEEGENGDEDNEGEDDAPLVAPPPERTPEQLRMEHRIESLLCHQPELFRVGRGTYVHQDALPVRQDLLREVVEWCVRRMRGRATAISTTTLLADLKKNGGAPAGLSAYLLKSVLSRHPDVVSLRKLLVGHAPSFQEHGRSLADRIEDVLHAADRPLTKEEVRAALRSRGTEFADPSIYVALLDGPFVLSLGDGRFAHVNRMGLAPRERAALVESALRILPEDGTPITARAILAEMNERPTFGDLVAPRRADVFLWALLRTDDRFECGPGGLVALKVADRSSTLLESVVSAVLRDLVVAPPREIRLALAHAHHFTAERSVYNTLSGGLGRGVFRRAFGSLYTLPEIAERTLVDALVARQLDEAARVADDAALAGVPTDQLDLVARTLYEGDRLGAARRVLDVLVHRDDLSDADRRRVRRLWQVVSVREEDVR